MNITWKMTLWNTILMIVLAVIILFFMLYAPPSCYYKQTIQKLNYSLFQKLFY